VARKTLRFCFCFPPIHGVYDTGEGVIYIFGEQHDEEFEEVLTHEILHWVIHKIAGKRACLKLDNIPPDMLKV